MSERSSQHDSFVHMPDWNESATVLRLPTGGGRCTYGPTLRTHVDAADNVGRATLTRQRDSK